ncbi:MAG TPA: PQQ-dependent sugar dehydrogenase [Longimicrobium sp.]|jgi:glucose/arabinose dehydrogenase
MHRLTLALIAALLAGCGGSPTRLPPAQSTPGLALDTVARGLQVPWDMAFAPDGRIFVTERPGRIRVIENGVLRAEPWAVLDVARRSELGLMGIALAPDFARSGHVYVVGSFPAGDGRSENRVYRLTERGRRGVDRTLVLGGMRVARYHAGAALRFGPDGMLYLSTGDATRPGEAQDTASLLGKVLRMRPDGGAPADNPRPGSRVYALGVRNPQGLAWHPDTRELFAPDHGPTRLPREFLRAGRDELNVIHPGANYGWPGAAGNQGGPAFTRPLVEWTPAVAPAALAFHPGGSLPWRGDALVATLRGQALLRVVLRRGPGGWRAVAQEPLFHRQLGRIRAVAVAPDGSVYFTTSNRDGRGAPRPGDDLLLRIVRTAVSHRDTEAQR